ncbi:MAG: tetratricopeptide repeat protein [Candidatus Melainabacteria bacterium]|nr:tetratricopeptide repeat protein [Candidatus Melainabacteria bacterium]
MKHLYSLASCLLVLTATAVPAWSQSAGDSESKAPVTTPPAGTTSTAPAKLPGVEFTKIQDLNPTARGTNRLVKQKWAVVIGTSKFKEGRLTPAHEGDMAQSAKEFYQYLTDPHGGRFDASHVKLLLDSDAQKPNIMNALGPSFLGSGAGPDDLVVVYIATSSFPTTDGNTYLCSYDCALDNIYGTCISMQSLMSTLKQNVKSDRIVLVLQAAYSGAAQLTDGAKSLEPSKALFNVDLEKVVMGNGFVILSSSQPNEITRNTAFSKNLISALRQEDGLISLSKAFAITREKTASDTSTADAKKKQVPLMKSTWTGTDLVIGAPPAERVANLPASVASFLSAEGAYLKASKLIADGKLDEALAQYKLAIAADPKYADALADCGTALALKGDWKAAAEMQRKAIAVNPTDALFRLNYARILDKLGDAENSMQELNTAYRLNPKDTSVLMALSKKTLAAGQVKDSVRYLEEAVDLYPARSDLRERLSYGLMKNGDVDQSAAQAKEAVRLDPKSASARVTLGSALMVQGYVVPAVNAYKDAAKLSPNDSNVHFLLSRAMEKSGDRDGAIAELSQFLQLINPSDPRAQQAKEHLEQLKTR